MSLVRHAELALLWKSLVPLKGQAGVEDLQTNTRKQ
jgi:hypothetical protein